MLNVYLQNLSASIQSLLWQEDPDILDLAKGRLDQAMDYIRELPVNEQWAAMQQIDAVLPMEWPLWVESTRSDEQSVDESRQSSQQVYH